MSYQTFPKSINLVFSHYETAATVYKHNTSIIVRIISHNDTGVDFLTALQLVWKPNIQLLPTARRVIEINAWRRGTRLP